MPNSSPWQPAGPTWQFRVSRGHPAARSVHRDPHHDSQPAACHRGLFSPAHVTAFQSGLEVTDERLKLARLPSILDIVY